MANPYDETDNFTSRLKVETTFANGDVRDHRQGFTQQEYFRNMQDKPQTNDAGGGFPPMKSCVKPSAPKGGTKQVRSKKTTKDDQSLIDANTKDLKSRNIK